MPRQIASPHDPPASPRQTTFMDLFRGGNTGKMLVRL
jgi:hypothetical protein